MHHVCVKAVAAKAGTVSFEKDSNVTIQKFEAFSKVGTFEGKQATVLGGPVRCPGAYLCEDPPFLHVCVCACVCGGCGGGGRGNVALRCSADQFGALAPTFVRNGWRSHELKGPANRGGKTICERWSIRFRLALRTCAPWGPSARVVSLRGCNEIKKNTHPTRFTFFFLAVVAALTARVGHEVVGDDGAAAEAVVLVDGGARHVVEQVAPHLAKGTPVMGTPVMNTPIMGAAVMNTAVTKTRS